MDERDDRTWAEKRVDARREARGLRNDEPRRAWRAGTYGFAAVVALLVGLAFLQADNGIGWVAIVLAVAWGAVAVIATANRISRD
jgi:hypothetical protein